jgi:hypothetical protein
MIWDSQPWKTEVARFAALLRKRKRQKRWHKTANAKVEQGVFYLAYAVRKLIEAKKISDEVEARRVNVDEHAPLGEAVDFMNWHKLDKLYDLASSKPSDLSVLDFCNQVIHSFVFSILWHEEAGGIEGFFISSDRQRAKGLFHVSLDEVLELTDAIVADDIVHSVSRRSSIGKPLEVVVKSNKMPVGNPKGTSLVTQSMSLKQILGLK